MTFQWADLDITLAGLKNHYRKNDFTPQQLIRHLGEKSKNFSQKNIWIYQLSDQELEPYLHALKNSRNDLPLFGVPFVIKDNIDLASIPTSAACPEFTYTPSCHASVVQKLIEAGAIPLGKTNMDQFATGLVGTRSPEPFGACKNAFNDENISGGSSSGSAVAVSLGLASFSLGTDTAGSGRVPAALNNIIGLKASRGLLSACGVVPACRSLDVVSIFALNVEDATSVFNLAAGYDEGDPYSRKNPIENTHRYSGVAKGSLALGVPHANQRNFFGDDRTAERFDQCLQSWQSIGAKIIEIDFSPFLEAAELLYQGPWVAERFIATKALINTSPKAMHPVVRKIIEGGQFHSAEQVFNAMYRLQTLKKLADKTFSAVDLIMTPTTGTTYSIAEVEQDPIALNSNLGYYTNFMNLLDYCGVAIPYEFSASDTANGFTLVAKHFEDQKLLAWAERWSESYASQLGATQLLYRSSPKKNRDDIEHVTIAVCGAHLSGQPLNWQLVERDAQLIDSTTSAENYRLYALADGSRPAMVRASEGAAIELELWKLPARNFGSFVAAIPPPLGIGKIELYDGTWVTGFICDSYGLEGALEITQLGSWRKHLSQA